MAITLFAIGFWALVALVFGYLLFNASASTNFSPYIVFGILAALVVVAGDLAVAYWYFEGLSLWGHPVVWYHCSIWALPQLLIALAAFSNGTRDDTLMML